MAELVEQRWGVESRRWFETWAAQAPEWLAVLRDGGQRAVGMSFYLDVNAVDPELVDADPPVRAFRDYLAQQAPLRAGERAMLSRFLLAGDGEGENTPGVAQLQCHNAFMPLKVPRLALTGAVRRDTSENRMQARYSGIVSLSGTEFELDGREFFIMGHDWRVEPAVDWMEGVAERLMNRAVPVEAPVQTEVMDEETFVRATKQALQALAASDDLDDLDLTRSLMVQHAANRRTDGASTGQVLRKLIDQAIEELAQHPHGHELLAVVRHTYLEPAPKQRAAAAEAGLSYGTYRRRLRKAVALIGEHLWQLEVSAGRPDSAP